MIALGFGPGRIGTLVSMATNSSHRVIMGKIRALTRILKIGVRTLPSRKSRSFSIHFYWHFSKSWSQIQKVGVKNSIFGVNESSGKCCVHSSAFIFDRIFFILAGNENIHNISHEFEIHPDWTKDCGVSCP